MMTKKINILNVHPIKSPPGTQYCLMPVGIIALANLLIREGYSVYGINPGIERSLDKNYELENDLKNFDYDLLLLDLHWYEHSCAAVEVARLSKRLFPGRPVIIGGFTATIFAGEILENFIEIDYAIKGDSEGPLLMLTDYIIKDRGRLEDIPNLCYRGSGKIINKDITYHCENIDQLDFITADFLKNKILLYFLVEGGLVFSIKRSPVYIGRGCFYDCSYCCGSTRNSSVLFGRDSVISRAPAAVANDMEKLVKQGVRQVSPTLDLEMFPGNYYKELFSIIKSRAIRIGLSVGCCQLPGKEFISALKNTFDPQNTQVNISVYTGDEVVRVQSGEKFSDAELLEVLEFMSQNEIRVHLLYALNTNGEKENSFEKTLKQIEDIAGFYPKDLLTIFCDRVFLDPLAPYREHLHCNLDSFMDYYRVFEKNDERDVGYVDYGTRYLDDKLNRFRELQEKLGI